MFKDDDEELCRRGDLPTEAPLAVVLEDLEGKDAHIYVVTRETVYRFKSETFMSTLKRYCESKVANDKENSPDLDKVRNATAALLGRRTV